MPTQNLDQFSQILGLVLDEELEIISALWFVPMWESIWNIDKVTRMSLTY